MKNYTNIYDIDGEIVRKANDNHKWTLDEAKERIQFYQEKIKTLLELENPSKEDLKKVAIYESYCKNLMNYEWKLMTSMNEHELREYFTSHAPEQLNKTTEEGVINALNDLKNDIERETNPIAEVPERSNSSNTEDTIHEESGNDQISGREFGDIHEKRPLTQSDLLVERDNVSPTIMDEYSDYEEVN